jgi:hypothetical protein
MSCSDNRALTDGCNFMQSVPRKVTPMPHGNIIPRHEKKGKKDNLSVKILEY